MRRILAAFLTAAAVLSWTAVPAYAEDIVVGWQRGAGFAELTTGTIATTSAGGGSLGVTRDLGAGPVRVQADFTQMGASLSGAQAVRVCLSVSGAGSHCVAPAIGVGAGFAALASIPGGVRDIDVTVSGVQGNAAAAVKIVRVSITPV